MKNLFKLLKYIIPYWVFALLNILFNVLSVIFSLVSLTMVAPFLGLLFGTVKLVHKAPTLTLNTQSIIDNFYYFISKIIIDHGQIKALLFICVLVIILFFLKNLFRYLGMYFIAPIRNGVVKDLRNDIYLKVLILPLSYYTEQKKGDIISRITNDVLEIEWSIMSSLEMMFREPLSIIVFLITLFIISPQLTLFVIILLPITGFLIGRIGKSLKRTSVKVQNRMGIILSVIEETISGLRIIKAFNAINSTKQKFRNINKEYTRLAIRLYRKRDLASPLSEFLGTCVMVIVMWFGAKMVLSPVDNLNAEVFIMYVVIFSQLIVPVKAFTSAFYNIQKGIASVERIKEVLDAEEIIKEKTDALPIKEFNKNIEYKNVSFKYDKDTVLKNINITISKGKVIAIVGPSGGGKSTFVDLLPRFYDCTDGEILIDDIPIKDYKIDDLRGLMGIVTQESILFNDTIFNNIAFGNPDFDENDIIEAAKIANAHDFIIKMENGYQSNIGDRGTKLSGGMKQRICIARAILKNPPILIMDEATSSLDTESEKLVQDALLKVMTNRTSIVIAHRLSTIQSADEIIVIQNGEIVERGNHQELLNKNGVYKKLSELQIYKN